MKHRGNSTRFTIVVPSSYVRELDVLSAMTGRPRNRLVRSAIEQMLEGTNIGRGVQSSSAIDVAEKDFMQAKKETAMTTL